MAEYAGRDVTVTMFGRPVAVQSIKHTSKQEKKTYFVLGKQTAAGKIAGRKELEGELVILQSEFDAIINSLPPGTDILDVAASDIVIVLAKGDRISTRILKNVEFMEFGEEMKAEDDMFPVTLPFIFESILINPR
jgi:hypothetical protein